MVESTFYKVLVPGNRSDGSDDRFVFLLRDNELKFLLFK